MSEFERSEPSNDSQANAEMSEVAGELTEWVYAGEVKAMALVTIDSDGAAWTRIVYKNGSKIELLGGVTILQVTMAGEMIAIPPKRNPLDADDQQGTDT